MGGGRARAQQPEALTAPALLAGQELIYHGRYSAAVLYFGRLAAVHPADPAPLALQASALIWWGEAQGDEGFAADSIDVLLTDAIARAGPAADSAAGDSARVTALFWLGTAYGYRARQAEARGSYWRASRDARSMQQAMQRALAIDSACVDCLLPLGLYDYGLARVGALARLVARIIGLGGGDAARGIERIRRAAQEGLFTRTEAQWVYANVLLRESAEDASLREESRRLGLDLEDRFPENPVFRRFLEPETAPTP